MATITVTGLQNRTKNCFAVSEELGLVLISNGEEVPYIMTPFGQVLTAGIPAPTTLPVASDGGAGSITDAKWVVYAYAYAMDNAFPLIASSIVGQPILSAPYQITGGGPRSVNITFIESTNAQINAIHIYRTALADSSDEAQLLADAGEMYLIATLDNDTDLSPYLDDALAVEGGTLIELQNFTVPQFRFCVFDGDYFWGFGNYPLSGDGDWTTDGQVIFSGFTTTDKFYSGRNGQYITFQDVTSGGIDGKGTFIFKYVSETSGQTIDENGDDLAIGTSGSGRFTIQGESATLYRSAYRNPFSWGYLQNVGGIYVPSIWQLKVGGGFGSAIAVVPNQNLLKLDMEFPTLCITFNLAAAANDQFESTKQVLSRIYSITSHFSQFPAISNGQTVLWGMDYKNFAVVESNGLSQLPISGPISTLLRQLTTNRYNHRLSHGVQDSRAELNAIWLTTNDPDSTFLIDYCIYYHWPTGFWGVVRDYSVLCSASIESLDTGERLTFVGTQEGYVGRAFDPTTFGNWLPNEGIYSGIISAATSLTITRTASEGDFSPSVDGYVGNYIIVVSPDGLQSEIRIIESLDESTITVDTDFTLSVSSGWKFFIGLIEVNLLKYFDNGTPSEDKIPIEYWATLNEVDSNNPPYIQYLPEHSSVPTVSIPLKQDDDNDIWFTKKGFPTNLGKSFGLKLVDRSYSEFKFYNFTLK